MALSRQDANAYIKKYINTQYDHVLTCSTNITHIVTVSENMTALLALNGSLMTTKGQIMTYSNTAISLDVGTDDFVLTADSTTPSGLSWKAAAGGGGGVALGETSLTAYRGDRGKIGYDHTLLTANPHGTTKAHLGLGSVDNTTDTAKPVSTAQQTALDLKEDSFIKQSGFNLMVGVAAGQVAAGDHTHSYTATDVGLGAVNNTADVNKPVSTAQQTALDLKADATQVLTNVPLSALFTDTTYTVGDGGLTQVNFTTADNTKLDGISAGAEVNALALTNAQIKTQYELNADTNAFDNAAQSKLSGVVAGANNYSHPVGDGNLHVPPNSTTNNGRVLTASGTTGVYTWEIPSGGFASPLTTKGDVLVYDTTNTRLPIGTNDQVLTADSAAATGMAWKTAAAGGAAGPMSGVRLEKTASQASTTGELTVIWATEVFDDDGFADLGTNNTRITVPTGVTRVMLTCGIDTASTSFVSASVMIGKNGETGLGQAFTQGAGSFSGSKGLQVTTGILEVVAGDYFEVKINFSANVNLDATAGTFFSCVSLTGAKGADGTNGTNAPTVDNTDDLGSATIAYKDVYAHRYLLDGDGDGVIGINTADAADNRRIRLTAGSLDTFSNARGASIDLHGNEHANVGALDLVAGGAAGEVTVWTNNLLRTRTAADGVTHFGYEVWAMSGGNNRLLFGSNTTTGNYGGLQWNDTPKHLALNHSTFGDVLWVDAAGITYLGGVLKSKDILLADADGLIGLDTVDGTDNRKLHIAAGSTDNPSNRGGSIDLYGNQHATKPGDINMTAGASGEFEVVVGTTSALTVALNVVTLPGQVTIAGGNPAIGKVLTCTDGAGVSDWQTPAAAIADVAVAGFIQGVITDAELLAVHVTVEAFSLPTTLTGSRAYADVTATATATIDVRKNNVSVGSINFAIGANVSTFTFAAQTSFAVGDRLSFVGQATADTTLADVSFTIKGTLL